MAASKLTQEERLRRKREAAKLRQRRCRAKKKREAELQKLRKSKSKSIVSPCKKIDSMQFMNLSKRSAFKPVTQMDIISGGMNSCPELPKDLLSLTPCSSSNSPTVPHLVTPQGSSSLPPMPPLSSSTKVEQERVNSTSTPPARIDEHELTAIDAILSLRRSPTTEPTEENIIPSPPKMLHCGTKFIQPVKGSLDYMHEYKAPLPFLPEIKSSASSKLPFPAGCKSVASRSPSYHPYENYGISRYAVSRAERGDLLMQKRCSLSPGVYFYYNGM
jgi:hypothetical protein